MKPFNPFLVSGYISGEFFCDRESETEKLLSYTKNRNNVTLISARRLGKTGLIHHVFGKLKKDKTIDTLYIDIFATKSIEDFIKKFSEAIIDQYPQKTTIGKQFWEIIKRLRPLFGFDSLTGQTSLQITFQTESEKTQTLKNILQFLEGQTKPIVVAIDEFQQILNYPDINMEAVLRTEIQHLQNVSFIFSGSKRQLMIEMFSNTKRPFYSSSIPMNLEKIEKNVYAKFIQKNFEKYDFTIDDESLTFILDWSQNYTFYTQFICNQLFSSSKKNIIVEDVKKICVEILELHTNTFIQIRELVTSAQWNYLIAIAKEKEVEKINAQDFLMKYGIGTPSNSRRLAKVLTERELILDELSMNKKVYRIYNIFFYHWLRENY